MNSGLNPAPSSSSAAIRPCVSTRPRVGSRIPLTICSSVLLPLPFGADHAQNFAALHAQAHIAQRPELLRRYVSERKNLKQPVDRPPVQTINLRNVLDLQQTSQCINCPSARFAAGSRRQRRRVADETILIQREQHHALKPLTHAPSRASFSHAVVESPTPTSCSAASPEIPASARTPWSLRPIQIPPERKSEIFRLQTRERRRRPRRRRKIDRLIERRLFVSVGYSTSNRHVGECRPHERHDRRS